MAGTTNYAEGDMASVLLTMTRSELGDLRGRIVKLKKEARSLSGELSGYSNGGQTDGHDPIGRVEAAYDCLDDAYLGFSADSDWVSVSEPDAKASLAKAALASQLDDLGIPVVAGKVRKSDIRKVLAESASISDIVEGYLENCSKDKIKSRKQLGDVLFSMAGDGAWGEKLANDINDGLPPAQKKLDSAADKIWAKLQKA